MKKIFAVILCLILALSFAGCKKDEIDGGNKKTANDSQYGYKVIHGFNSYLELVNFKMGTVGDLSLNDFREDPDKNFITEGEASARWQAYDPDTEKDKQVKKNFYIPTLTVSGDRYDDFSRVVNVRMDVYNNGSSNVVLTTALAKISGSVSTDTFQNHVIKAKEWNTVNHTVERASVDLFMNIADISHISLSVEGINTDIYLDNLRFEYSPIAFVPVEMTLDENEICSFDKPYQESVFYLEGSSVSMYEEVKIETNPLYTKGGNSLKVKNNSTFKGEGWPRIWFSTKYMQKVNLAQYKKTDYIAMDIYKTFDKSVDWGMSFTLRNAYYGSFQNLGKKEGFALPAGVGWHTVKIPLNAVTVTNPDMMCFSFQNATFCGTTLYIDNIRIIKGV